MQRAEDPDDGSPQRPELEIGWVLDSRLDGLDRDAVLTASRRVSEALAELFSGFDWRMPLARHELPLALSEEPSSLLEAGSSELARQTWDLSIVVTASDLRSHFVSSAVGVLSRPLGVAVLSTFRLDPLARNHRASDQARMRAMEERLFTLGMYVIGRLCGLARSTEEENPMNPGRDPAGRERAFTPSQVDRLRSELERIGDERVEEERGSRDRGRLEFQARAAWRNRLEILHNAVTNRSWEFPLKMGRLTTAAFSALAILLVTAESWEIGSQLSPRVNAFLALGIVGVTSVYLLQHQRLLTLHRSSPLTEQIVVTRLSLVFFVLMGMAATYGLVFAASLLLEWALFHQRLVGGWIGVPPEEVGWSTYASQAAFTSGIAILVGALGASFERESYVRHIAYVDEEV